MGGERAHVRPSPTQCVDAVADGHILRADHLWDLLATSSKWFDELLQNFELIVGSIDTERLMKWARGKGRKLAPNWRCPKSRGNTFVACNAR